MSTIRALERRKVRKQRAGVAAAICGFVATVIAACSGLMVLAGNDGIPLREFTFLGEAIAVPGAAIALVLATRGIWVRTLVVLVTVALVGTAWIYIVPQQSQDQPGVTHLVGGCTPFLLFSQNIWKPYGALIYKSPYPWSDTQGTYGFAPNQHVWVDGWVRTVRYQDSGSKEFNQSKVWYHLTSGYGWVTFAGVRALQTVPDPKNGFGDGGPPAPHPGPCEGALGGTTPDS